MYMYIYMHSKMMSPVQFLLAFLLLFHPFLIFSMARIYVGGHDVRLVVEMGWEDVARVLAHALAIRFDLVATSIIVELEVCDKNGAIKEGVLQTRGDDLDGYYWMLLADQYKPYRLSNSTQQDP